MTPAEEGPDERADIPIVLFVALASGLGGSVRSLATALDQFRRNTRIALACPPHGSFMRLVEERGGVDFQIPLTHPHSDPTRRASRLLGAVSIALWAWRRRGSLVAIHANGPEEINITAPAALLCGIPLIVWCHSWGLDPWTRRLGRIWGRVLRRHDVHWAAISPTARRVLTEAGLTQSVTVTIIPDPIDPLDVRAANGARRGPVTIGFIGANLPRKGIDLLPTVMNLLDDIDHRWVLYTNPPSGSGSPTWDAIRAMPAGRVTVHGFVLDVRQAYAACDIVFIPSYKESFCRVAAEAMLNGLPVVASDLEPLRALVGNNEAGLLFPRGDARAAAEALRQLIDDPQLRAKLGRSGVERASAFAPEEIAKRLGQLYKHEPALR